MLKIKWSKSLNLGIRAIDDQHQYLVDICNEFIRVVQVGMADEAIQETVARLREYSVQHFHDEENFMEQIRYPSRGEHQVAHMQLVRQIKRYQREIYKRRDVMPEEIRDFLKGWLLDHIMAMDLDIARWLREEEERKSPPEGQASTPRETEREKSQ